MYWGRLWTEVYQHETLSICRFQVVMKCNLRHYCQHHFWCRKHVRRELSSPDER